MRKILLLSLGLSSQLLLAQESLDINYYLPQNMSYNEDIPKPSDIIGHEVGEWHITHNNLMFYIMALSKNKKLLYYQF